MDHTPLDWVADFDDTAARPQRSRTLTVALGALFGGGGFAAIALLVTAMTRSAEEETGRGATVVPTAAPVPTAVQSSAAPAPARLLPSACGGLFSEAMTVTLDQLGFELSARYDGPWHTGSSDEQLRAQLDAASVDSTALTCHWTTETAGLLTHVAEVDAQHQAAAIERLEQLDYTRLSEHGGTRYFVERQSATGATGESHFFRDDLWFATHWLEHGQYGYTADMVRSVFD
jgi:hypothetical protein